LAVFCEVGIKLFAVLYVLNFISNFAARFYFLYGLDGAASRYFVNRYPNRGRNLIDSDDGFIFPNSAQLVTSNEPSSKTTTISAKASLLITLDQV
jgi:hypothetical protein